MKKPYKAREKPTKNKGRIACLKCRNAFNSVDVKRNRLCPKCEFANRREYVREVFQANFTDTD